MFGDAIHTKRMFGGFGMYVDRKIIGILVRDRTYLKTDDESRKAFVAEKCKPFNYQKKTGEGVSLRYFAIPERLYDEPDEFAQWVRKAELVSDATPKKVTTTSRARKAPGSTRRRA